MCQLGRTVARPGSHLPQEQRSELKHSYSTSKGTEILVIGSENILLLWDLGKLTKLYFVLKTQKLA